ncbi:MAG: hypothetical protein D4R73_07040 [Deltaproteobacteria bacterium]|nr:MAG: hypothetical protein D4R73_07040 [Deltaproteobacteria bacterium]
MNLSGLTAQDRKLIYKKEESNLKRACTYLLKTHGGFSLPLPGGMGAVNGSPDRICFYEGRAVSVEFKVADRKLSRTQEEMKANIEATGNVYAVVRCEADFAAAMGLPVRMLF